MHLSNHLSNLGIKANGAHNSGDQGFHPIVSWLEKPYLIYVCAALCLIIAVLGLAFPLSVPIGPMYWDTFLYYDAINRMDNGQVPLVDFNTPVGPLNYWLVAFLYQIFPNGQPALLIHWSLMLLSLPIMTIVARVVAQRSTLMALALFLPFLLYSLFPFGTINYHSFAGVEGFGYYNRHGALMLYVLVCTIFFVQNSKYQIALLALCGATLFLGKITAFIAGLMILGYAFVAGFVSFLTLIASLSLFLLALAGLQLASGTIWPYILSIWQIASENQESILSRFPQVISEHFDVVAATSMLVLVLFLGHILFEKKRISDVLPANGFPISKIASHDFLAVLIVLFAGIFFETQNTGSQAFIMVWPVIFLTLLHRQNVALPYRTFILVLALFAIVPTMTKIAHKGLRTIGTYPTYGPIENDNLGPLGQVVGKDIMLDTLAPMREFYIATQSAKSQLAKQYILPDFILYSEPTFQMTWLIEVNRAIEAIYAYERAHNVRFDVVHNLDFTNPFAFLMERRSPKYVQIGADPNRTLRNINDKIRSEIAKTDLILRPTCPILANGEQLYELYKPVLDQTHEAFEINECYIGYKKRP